MFLTRLIIHKNQYSQCAAPQLCTRQQEVDPLCIHHLPAPLLSESRFAEKVRLRGNDDDDDDSVRRRYLALRHTQPLHKFYSNKARRQKVTNSATTTTKTTKNANCSYLTKVSDFSGVSTSAHIWIPMKMMHLAYFRLLLFVSSHSLLTRTNSTRNRCDQKPLHEFSTRNRLAFEWVFEAAAEAICLK